VLLTKSTLADPLCVFNKANVSAK